MIIIQSTNKSRKLVNKTSKIEKQKYINGGVSNKVETCVALIVWVNLTVGPIVGLPAFGVGIAVDTNEGVRVVVGTALRRVGAGNEISVGVKVSVGTGEGIFEGTEIRSGVAVGKALGVGVST